MTENIVVNGFTFELEIKLKPNQSSSRKKRSLDNISVDNDYDLLNNSEIISNVPGVVGLCFC
jgi:hypothetical protein